MLSLKEPMLLRELLRKIDPLVMVYFSAILLQAYVVCCPNPKLMVWPDSVGYMTPAISYLESGVFSHAHGRGFLYPLFLLIVLQVSNDPVSIIWAQRLLVVATCAFVAQAIYLLTRHSVAERWVSMRTGTWLAAFWLLVFVLYPPVTGLAHAVMPETMFSTTLAMVLLGVTVIGLRSTEWRYVRFVVALTAFIAVVLSNLKPHWLIASFLVPLLVVFLASRSDRIKAIPWVVLGVLLALIMVMLPEKMLQEKYDGYTSKIFGPRSLFCNSADLIEPYLSVNAANSFENKVALALQDVLSPDARMNRGGWVGLGFDGDRCFYHETGALISKHFSGDADAESRFYVDVFRLALLNEPAYLIYRLHSQFGLLASSSYRDDLSVFIATPVVVRGNQKHELFRTWYGEYKLNFAGRIETAMFKYFSPEMMVLYRLARLALAVGIFFGLVRILMCFRKDYGRGLDGLGRLFLCFTTIFFAINLLISIVHTFDVWRYAAMQAPLFSMLGLSACLLAIHGRHAHPSGGGELGCQKKF